MKRAEAERCLGSKLGLERLDSKRHVTFDLRLNGQLILPIAVRLSHGSGEITGHILGTVAKDLGLREREFASCAGCNIGRDCVYLCLITRLLRRVDPLVLTEKDLLDLVKLVGLLIQALEQPQGNSHKWNGQEGKILIRVEADLMVLKEVQHLDEAASRALRIIVDRR